MDEAALRNVRGTIFNIQHYSIHDGPGIRTNVFLKGCPLRCIWCSNPESQKPVPQLMFRADRCTGCGACISSCPSSAISLQNQRIQNDRSLCTGCGACAAVCPNEAREIIGTSVTAGEVFDEVAQDELFYAKDGGVTLTGGEVDSFGDHRVAMAFTILSLIADGPVTISHPECVSVSAPDFYRDLKIITS